MTEDKNQIRLLLDEDIPHSAASIERTLGLDIVSIHELGRLGWTDPAHLTAAAEDGRAFVTYNRNDFIHWTTEFFRTGRPHAGLVVLSRSLPRDRPDRIAHALDRWVKRTMHQLQGHRLPPFSISFISGPHRL